MADQREKDEEKIENCSFLRFDQKFKVVPRKAVISGYYIATTTTRESSAGKRQ